MISVCILPNTFDYYKPKALKVMPSDATPIFTDDFVKTVLESDAVRYFENNDRSLFKDYDAIATKALIKGYVRTLEQSSDDNVRKFIPDDVNKKLNIELANIQLTPKSVASYIDKVKKSIVSESIVSDGGNVEIKQDLTLADYGVETTNGAQDLLTKWRGWLKSNPHGIVAYRTDRNKFSDPKYTLETRSIGNPFMGWLKDGQKGRDTELFRDWLLTGNNAGNSLATEELRQAYLQLINDAAKNNAKVLYYTNISPSQSHASVIGDLIKQGGFNTKQNTPQPTVAKNATTEFDVSNAEFYSGDADGSDKEWGKQARALGIKVKDYLVNDYNKLSNDWKNRIENEYQTVVRNLARTSLDGNIYKGQLVRRDMMQADKADAIFAIGTVVASGKKGKTYTNKSNHDVVDGGTGYAVQRGIDRGIPVYVFDQSDSKWKKWNKDTGKFEETNMPKLTPNAATVGTREIEENSKEAIKNILEYTIFNKRNENTLVKTNSPKTISSSKLSNTVLYSNYSASDGLFNNANVDTIDDMLKNGSEVIVLFTNTQSERDEAIAKAMEYNKGKAKKDWCILRINPSDDEIKTVIANHNKIGIFRGNNSTERNIDNLYKNVTITTSKADIDNADFMENHDLNLFSNKVRHLYTQNRLQHLDAEREQIMRWVLQDIQKEYDDMSDADKDTYKGIMLKKLADNYEHVTSLITVTEQVDTDSLEDYDYEDGEDVLWSEQHNTSNMPKDDILASVLASFQTGKEDELGTPLYYDSMVINNILTRTISGSKDSNDMIGRLKSAQRYNKWMDKLIENINSDITGRLKSILFTKYANLYAAKYVTINGNRIIDESNDFATTSINVGVVSEMDEKRSPFSKEITDATCKNISDGLKMGGSLRKLPDGHPYREQYKQYLDDNNSRLVFYLAQAGIELNPDEHDINALTDDELTTIRQNLAMIYQLRARDGWMETENFIANCKSSYSKILAVLNKYSNQKTESTVRTAGESKFVYADKNYIDTIFDGLDEDYKAFMQKEFLDYGEFTSDHSGDYEKMSMQLYSSLLRDLALSTKKPEWFRIAHFFVNKENGKNPAKYSDLTKDDLAEINRKMFWKEQGITKQGDKQYVWVHAPIYADKGQLHFYRVPIVELEAKNLNSDNPDETKPQILTEIVNLIKFETNRISNAKKRWKLIQDGKLEPIDCYDILKGKPGNAHKYCFQPMLNEYGVDENGKPVSLYDILAAEDSEENREYIMEQAAAKIIANIIKQDCKQEIKGTDTEKDVAEGLNNQVDEWAERIEETLSDNLDGYNKLLDEIRRFDYAQSKEKRDRQKQWEEDNDIENDENTTSAQVGERMIERIQRALTSYVRQADILQLTISDPAMYKGEVDVQKRYAQVQAGYSRPDIKSKYAKRFMSTLYLKDNEIDLESVDPVTFNIMRATLERASKAANIDLNVDEIMKSFKKVNVADAQCYRTLSSYRAVRDMFGQWTAKDDALFEKIRNGEQLTADDYMQVWQTLKPFVYTQQPSEWVDADGVKHKTKVGYQYKNSENVLFNMYLLFNGGKKTVLGELNRFMEQYKIDTAQFESAVKVGREGLIDLNNIDAESVFEYLEEQTGVKDQTTKLKYTDIDENGNEVEKEEELPGNPHVIHRIPYKEYGIKTSTPPHMFDVEQQLGSQLKKLLQGDIPDDAKIYLDTDGLFGNESESPFGEGNRTILVNGEVLTLSENKEIQPDGTEETRWSLNKQDYLKLYNGLLNDLILSEYGNVQDIFKDRERLSQALQEMMGTSPKYDYDIKQALKVKDGKFIVDPKNPAIRDKVVLLMSSILKNRINKQLTKGGTAIQMACWKRQPPLNIVRNPDGTIKYMECLMPAYSKQWVEAMMNKDGVLDPKKCKDENLLKALCYRVPTEDIYSMIPLKIVGFTPLQFGTNIMLPQEITTLTGSDFDVDKMYLFLPEFELKDKWNIGPKVARERFEKSLVSKTADYEADVEIKNTNKRRSENEEPELTDEEKEKIRKRIKKDYFNAYCVEQKYKVQEPRYIQFDSKKDISDNSKAQKCNLLLSLMRGAISSPHNITKEQNPGGFDYLKELAEEINPEVNKPMNLTESQYLNFFNLNMTGKRLIGIYANHNVAHSLCQDSGLGLAKSIKIGDNEYNSLSGIYSTDKRRISRNIAEFLAASVDNAKDPVLAKLWQNNYTASTTCFLMRLGVPPKTILKMYKMLKDKCPEDFNKFMERGPAAFRKYADKYNADLKLGINVKFQDGNKNVNTYNFFAMLGYYEKTIQNLETLNSLLKSDSTNGAMYDVTSIIENILKVKKLKQDQNLVNVDKLIPDFENDKELLNKSKFEILKDIEQKVGKGKAKSYQVAYYLTWANFRQYFNEIIDDKMINECINLGMQLPNFSADDIKHFIADYTKQQLRYLDMFAPRVESMKKNRKQLMELGLEEASKYRVITTSEIIKNTLEEIPKKLEEYKRKYKDNAFIQMLSRVQQKDGVFLMIKNIADMRAETVNEVKEAFNQLYSNISSYRDAMDLIRYTLCVNGFGYDPRSFVSMIPIKTLAKVKGIENIFEFFEIDKLDNFEDNFIIKNDLVDYSVKIPSKHDNVFFMPTKSKIIGKRGGKDFMGFKVDPTYYKKLYETKDGAYYVSMKEKEQPDTHDKIYEVFDKEIVSNWLGAVTDEEGNFEYDSDENLEVDEEVRKNSLKAIVDDVMKEAALQGLDTQTVTKEDLIKILNSENALGRYFNLDADPMSVYEPIAIEFC